MSIFNPLKQTPEDHAYSSKDALVIFGEVFDKGYVNGLIVEAQKCNMKIIYSTVGRRDKDGQLRKLNSEELVEKSQPLINIPLEAGFDMTADNNGRSPVDQLKGVGLKGWQDVSLDWGSINESKSNYNQDFQERVRSYVNELTAQLEGVENIVFVHTMAGGFPRAKAVMPIANKVFKGIDERYQSSEEFWNCDIGKLCSLNFDTVTADTFSVFLQETADLANKHKQSGHKVSYIAYGYHGNEVLIDDNFAWHSYSPYLQGWAKVKMENYAKKAWENETLATVYNVPEILTNSSSIFLGIEVVIYPLLKALKKLNPDNTKVDELIQACNKKLKDSNNFEHIDKITQEYLQNPEVNSWPQFEAWPQHNGPQQMKTMRETSSAIIDLHEDKKDLMTAELSEIVFRACGLIMLRHAYKPSAPVVWIGHKQVSKCYPLI